MDNIALGFGDFCHLCNNYAEIQNIYSSPYPLTVLLKSYHADFNTVNL